MPCTSGRDQQVTDEELAEVERLDREATAGEWKHCEREPYAVFITTADGRRPLTVSAPSTVGTPADAALIARFRTLAPRLVSEVRYLRAVSGAWKLLASALILYRGRGNESDVLQAVANLDKLGVKVP